jgi:hypothetical protein
MQGWTNPGRYTGVAIKSFTVARNFCLYFVWNFLHVIFVAAVIFWLLLDLLKNYPY